MEKLLTSQNRNYWHYFGESTGYRGIGFYIKSYLKNRIVEIKGINKQIGYLKMQIDKGVNICILQIYAPTAGAEEEEVEHFYKELVRITNVECSNLHILRVAACCVRYADYC